jgi:hypothetical protein
MAILALKHFPDGHVLDLLVDSRCRMGGILQLLLTQTNRLDAFWRNLERRHQRASRIASALLWLKVRLYSRLPVASVWNLSSKLRT